MSRVFVAGASGAIGRPLVECLAGRGHEVTGMTRREEHAAAIGELGGRAVVCDVYDVDALRRAMSEARPEVVVHQLTALPWKLDPRRPGTYAATNRLRTEGTRNLTAAAVEAGARRIVAQSIAFAYEPVTGSQSPAAGEEAPTMSPGGGPFGSALAAVFDLEGQVTSNPELEGMVLRYGFFYGPGTAYARDGHIAREVSRRRMPVVGSGAGVFSFVHVEDAALATALACESDATGVLNVCDDEPAPMREWLPAYAAALGARPPLRVPAWLAHLVAGGTVVEMATAMRGAANGRAKATLGWRPARPSWRRGFAEALG